MQTLICLVRHGATDWNFDGRAQGRADIPLNAEGRRQAEAVAARLAAEPWDAIYASPSVRAYHTAEAIARRASLGAPATDPRLMERDMAHVEGLTPLERRQRWPHEEWRQIPGIESDEEVAARATPALTEIARRHPGQRVVVVTHGGLISAFVRSLVPAESRGAVLFSRNTAVTRVIWENGAFRQETSPDHSHILIDGIEYTGEKGRLLSADLSGLAGLSVTRQQQEHAILEALGVEAAWHGDRLVGFARLCPRGTCDLLGTAPEFTHLERTLLERLKARYPEQTA